MPGWTTNLPSDYFALGLQSAKDVEATTFTFLKHRSGTGMDLNPEVQSEREGGDGKWIGHRYKSRITQDGAFVANARSQINLIAMAGALGKLATVIDQRGDPSLATGLLKFRFVDNPTLPYLTFEQRFADQIERVSNGKVNSLDVSGEAGRAIELNGQFLTAGTPYWRDPVASSLTPTREAMTPAYYPLGSYVFTGGASGAHMTKFRVSIRNGVDDGIQTTQLFRDDVLELTTDVDLDTTLKYVDAALYRTVKYNGGTTVPLPIPTGSFDFYMSNQAAGTMMRSLRIAGAVDFADAKVNKLDPDGKTVYVDVAAMVRPMGTSALVVDVVAASQAAPI